MIRICCRNIARIRSDNLTARFIISEEATFYINSKVNRHDICVWRTANHHTTLNLERDSSKQNVFCAITKDTIHDPFISVGTPSRVTLVQKCFPYGLCTSWKKIWMTWSSSKMSHCPTSTWLLDLHKCKLSPVMNWLCRNKWHVVQMAGDHQTTPLVMGTHEVHSPILWGFYDVVRHSDIRLFWTFSII